MDPTVEWNSLVAALRVHDWYAIVAIVMLLTIQLFRSHPLTADTWQKIPEGWRFLPAVITSFSIAFVKAFLDKAAPLDAVVAGVGGVLGIAIPAMGLAAALKESKLPWDGGAGGGKVTLVLLMLLGAPAVTACGGGDTGALVARSEHLAYNSAVVAVEFLDQLDLKPDDRARLERARELLSVARQAIDLGKHTDAAEATRQALAALQILLDEAKADGAKLPDSLVVAIDDASLLFGNPSSSP